ncbi:hypothetical protein ES703_30304 [subsurface metagenome]
MKQVVSKAENAACATVYWFIGRLCPGIYPDDKMELAAKIAISYYAVHKTAEEALSYIQAYMLYESEFWKSIEVKGGEDGIEARP